MREKEKQKTRVQRIPASTVSISVSTRISRLSSVSVPPVPLPIHPSLHRDVRRIESSFFGAVSVCAFDFSGDLARRAPREVVHVEEGVGWEDEVPDRKRTEVDEHPTEVGETARGDDDQDGRNTEDESEKDERDGRFDGTGNDSDDDQVADTRRRKD